MKKKFERWFIKMLIIAIDEQNMLDYKVNQDKDFKNGLLTREETRLKLLKEI